MILIINTFIIIIPILLSIALVTLAERKIIGYSQRRLGPTRTGFYGLLQPISDALKLLVKEIIIPMASDIYIFIISCIWILFVGLASYNTIYFSNWYAYIDNDYGIIYLLVISALTIYGLLFAGYSSNSKYSLLGSIRSISSMISYEISIGIIIVSTLIGQSYNIYDILEYQGTYNNLFLNIPLGFLYFISVLAESNRIPFDLTEAESELTAGPYTEYSGLPFAYFFLAEYSTLILHSILFCLIFLNYQPFNINISFISSIIFSIKVIILIYIFIWIRASLPRIRYDKLIIICWNILLPISLSYILFIILFLSNIY